MGSQEGHGSFGFGQQFGLIGFEVNDPVQAENLELFHEGVCR